MHHPQWRQMQVNIIFLFTENSISRVCEKKQTALNSWCNSYYMRSVRHFGLVSFLSIIFVSSIGYFRNQTVNHN